MRHLILALIVLIAVLAIAACDAPADRGYGTVYSDAMPPSRYLELTPFTIVPKKSADLAMFCRELTRLQPPEGKYFGGCEDVGRRTAYLSDPCAYPGEVYAHKVCHAMAHLNGWPADHPVR